MGLRLVTDVGRPVQGRRGGAESPALQQGNRVRDALGARVQIMRSSGPTLWRRARADGSYASANDPRVLVGLGASTEQPRVKITWPSGRVESFDDVPIDKYSTLREGSGRP